MADCSEPVVCRYRIIHIYIFTYIMYMLYKCVCVSVSVRSAVKTFSVVLAARPNTAFSYVVCTYKYIEGIYLYNIYIYIVRQQRLLLQLRLARHDDRASGVLVISSVNYCAGPGCGGSGCRKKERR